MLNGAGELTGRSQVEEWGLPESPVFLTSTMQVGRVYDAACRLLIDEQPRIGVDDVVIPIVGECDDSWLTDAAHACAVRRCGAGPRGGAALGRRRWEHVPGSQGDRFLIVTNLDAESFRIATAPVDAPGDWSDYVAEDPATRIYEVDAFDSAVVVSARREGVGMLTVCPYGDAPYDVWPDQAGGLVTPGRNEVFDADFVTVVQQWFIHQLPRGHRHRIGPTQPASRRADCRGGPDAYVQERHLAPASDGAGVPVVVMHRLDVDLDGRPPLYMYGYGCTRVDPDFGYDWWRSLPSLLDRGVVCAFGQPRGGGELGRRWWLDGHLR